MHEYPNEHEWEPYDGVNGFVLTKPWEGTTRMMKCLVCQEAMISTNDVIGARHRSTWAKQHAHSWKQKKMTYRSGWGWGFR